MEAFSGTFEMINPNLIIVDHRYQRPRKEDLISFIALRPSWPAFGVVVCSKRSNNQLYCLDGQQRLAGLMESLDPPRLVPVIWHAVSSPEHEAEIFADINEHRKGVMAIEKFTARLMSKDPTFLQVDNAVTQAGYSIGNSSGEVRTISAVNSLFYIYALGGEKAILDTLVAFREAWPESKPDSAVLKAIGHVVAEQESNYDRPKTVRALQRTAPDKLLREAKAMRFEMGGSLNVNLRRALKKQAKI